MKFCLIIIIFDIIICEHVLHHIKNLYFTMYELNRITKLGGFIYITEHITYNNLDRMLVDIEHRMFEVYFNEKTSSYIKTFNWVELDIIFDKFGFSYYKGGQSKYSINYIVNSTNKAYLIYRKDKDLTSKNIYKKTKTFKNKKNKYQRKENKTNSKKKYK